MQTVEKSEQPELFQDPRFKGALYRLDEPVLDIPSVLKAITEPWQDRILKIPADTDISWHKEDTVQSLQIDDNIEIKAQQFVLTAGEGNQALLDSLGITSPSMQRRPLQMVMCKTKDKSQPLPPIYAHSLGSGSKPIATITSHLSEDGNIVWYIGGNIAEQGVGKSFTTLTSEATTLLRDILPWFEPSELEWATHTVNRAEPKQSSLSRPDTAFVETIENVHIAWPTKLALAPDLADKIIESLNKLKLIAGTHVSSDILPPATIAQSLWDRQFK